MLKFLLLAIFLVAYLILSYKRPKWALYFIIALPFSYLVRFELAGLHLTLLESMILILFGVWGCGKWRRHERIKIDNRLCLWLGLLFFACLILVFFFSNFK